MRKKSAFKWAVLIFAIVIVAYIGVNVYAAWSVSHPKTSNAPPIKQAQYQLIVANTGTMVYTNNYTQNGTAYTVHGYWIANNGVKWVYYSGDFTFDEKVFGRIVPMVRRATP